MQHDLVGYLLNALEPSEHAEVQAYLHADPEAPARLEEVRQTLAPLALDKALDPPFCLATRTLTFVNQATPLLPEPAPAPRWGTPSRRVIELAVAACVVLTVGGLITVWLARLRGLHPGEGGTVQLVECRDNLQKLFVPLRSYADTHQGHFPNVATAVPAPRNSVALVYPMLREAKVLPADANVGCPAACQGCLPGDLNQVKGMDESAYQEWVAQMKSSYAYSLGYRHNGQVVSLRLDEGKPASLVPLLADSPPADPKVGNSANHGGRGQHVLFADGHVTFCQSRHVGYNQDDIYLNRERHVAAGLDWTDTVLASGATTP